MTRTISNDPDARTLVLVGEQLFPYVKNSPSTDQVLTCLFHYQILSKLGTPYQGSPIGDMSIYKCHTQPTPDEDESPATNIAANFDSVITATLYILFYVFGIRLKKDGLHPSSWKLLLGYYERSMKGAMDSVSQFPDRNRSDVKAKLPLRMQDNDLPPTFEVFLSRFFALKLNHDKRNRQFPRNEYLFPNTHDFTAWMYVDEHHVQLTKKPYVDASVPPSIQKFRQ